MHLSPLSRLALIAAPLFAVACSSGGSSTPAPPAGTAPAIQTATQNRTVDPTGRTVDLFLTEPVAVAGANETSSFTVSTGSVLSATLQPDARTVRVTLDIIATPGVVTLGLAAANFATGNIALSALPSDGDSVTLSDDSNSFTFEFTSGGGAAGANIEVNKGASPADAIASLISSINGSSLGITASAGAGDSANLGANSAGAAFNVAITENDSLAAITVTGMSGGSGPVSRSR